LSDKGAHAPEVVAFTFDNETLTGAAGRMLAAVLIAQGRRILRRSPRAEMPRGAFCLMGSCQECLVDVDGHRRLACRTSLVADMDVRRVTLE
jgi:predicted molibdopterin-dependent oxidoreductase YjgC